MKDNPTDSMREVARHLLSHESPLPLESTEQVLKALAGVHEKLHAELAPMVGEAGFQALLARSVRLAHLTGVETRGAVESSSAKLYEYLTAQPTEDATEAAVTWVTVFLELFATLIGRGLTLRLLDQAWPGKVQLPQATSEKK